MTGLCISRRQGEKAWQLETRGRGCSCIKERGDADLGEKKTVFIPIRENAFTSPGDGMR
jgi:hypothetical protein